jgi:hypothetical protein
MHNKEIVVIIVDHALLDIRSFFSLIALTKF